MRRSLAILALCLALFTAPRARAQASAGDFEQAIAPALDSIYMLGVARRNSGGPEVFQFIGTGWVIAEGKLATNAHVAEALLESSAEGRLVAKRSWSDRDELALTAKTIRVHPAYGPWNARLKRVVVRNENDPAAARSISFIPVADVAIVEVEAGNTATPLVLADPTKVEPSLSEPVVYLGFPHENIAGYPTLHAVPGYVTAKTDFFFQRTTWSDSFLIHYCGPVVGGASGSPMLNRAGQVIGLISAAENNLSANGERTSFGFAYGQRVDLVRELLRDDYETVQALRDKNWSERLAHLLLPPDELLEQMAAAKAEHDGVPQLTSANTVTRRQVVVKQTEPARLQVTLDPGLRYGFLAAAHDGSDVDAQVLLRDGETVLGVDVETDYFPMVWIGPLEERTAVTFEIVASERLLQDTACSLHVYKYEPMLVPIAADDNSAVFFSETFVVPEEGTSRATWSFTVETGANMLFSAESDDGYDIDLALALDGVIEATDDSADSIPMVQHEGAAGTIELRLQIPQGTKAGALIALKGVLLEGPRPTRVGEAPAQGASTPEAVYAQLDAFLDEIWKQVGTTGATSAQDVIALVDFIEIEFEIPAGVAPLFIAYAPGGENVDIALFGGDDVLAQDVEADNQPLVGLPAAQEVRTIKMRLSEPSSETPVNVGYRLSLIRAK